MSAQQDFYLLSHLLVLRNRCGRKHGAQVRSPKDTADVQEALGWHPALPLPGCLSRSEPGDGAQPPLFFCEVGILITVSQLVCSCSAPHRERGRGSGKSDLCSSNQQTMEFNLPGTDT